jgi:GT2 family glycosyltransferase
VTNDEASEKVSIILPTVSGRCIWCSMVMTSLTTTEKREIIVVADRPDELRLRLFARFGVKLVANPERVGTPRAFNQGIRMSTRPYVLILNDDILPITGDFLAKMVEALEKHPEFGMVAPRVLRPWSEDKAWYAALGEGSLMSRRMIDDVGLFDESPEYAGLGTDGDYFARARAKGYKFHGIPTSMILHNCGQTIGELLTEEYCKRAAKKLKDKWGDLPDQHILPEYLGD